MPDVPGTILEIISRIADCNISVGYCDHESDCPTKAPWQVINRAVQEALESVMLARLATDDAAAPTRLPTTP